MCNKKDINMEASIHQSPYTIYASSLTRLANMVYMVAQQSIPATSIFWLAL